jgi:cytochrome c biogenesis protein CcmG, thiol:disulfide interchange protein DsbE
MVNVPDSPGESSPPSARAVLRWFRLVGVPLIAITVIASTILLLRDRDTANSVRLDTPREDGSALGRAKEGQPAPDFTLTASDGSTYRLSELRGRPVVINFWATWCGPCKDEMPAIDEAYQTHRDAGLIVLAVNVEESAERVATYAAKLKLTFPVLVDREGSVSARYRVRSLPTTVFVRPDGVIDGRREGAYTRRMLLGRIEQFMEPQ